MNPLKLLAIIFLICGMACFVAGETKKKPIESPKTIRYAKACTLNVIHKLKHDWDSSDKAHNDFWYAMKRCEV